MKRKITLPLLGTLLLSSYITSCNGETNEVKLQSLNNQSGVILGDKGYSKNAVINEKSVNPYLSYSKEIILRFDTHHVDTNYNNKLIINDTYEYDLKPSNESFDTYYTTEINLLGLNIIDGNFKVKFVSGSDKTGISLDTFYVRNVVLLVKDNEIWSEEYTKDNYLNEKIGLGESEINSDIRFGIVPQRTFTYNIAKSMLDCKGYMFAEEDYQDLMIVKTNNKTYEYENPLQSFSINLENNELIKEDRKLEIFSRNSKEIKAYMDGIEVSFPLTLSSSCWVKGKHLLEVIAYDEYGSILKKEYNFELADNGVPNSDSTYKVYNNGTNKGLTNSITNLGVEVSLENEVVTPFSSTPFVNFEITNNPSCNVVWKGKVNKNRVAFLQLYNYVKQSFDTVSTNKSSSSDEELLLAANYSNLTQYIKDGKTIARVSSKMIQDNYLNPDGLINHLSDVQYIVEKSAAQGDSILGKEAKTALTSLNQYVIDQNPDYALISGDLVQSTVDIKEWEDVMEYLIDPILENDVPLGVSSGNHDVGGLNAVNPNGSNGLDDALVYDYYEEYVGEDKFKDKSYYGGSFENNRSHYDVVNIAGHDFLFLHLGWGSSIYGIHVSIKDINWAKTILEANKDKTVVLSTHEYLGATGSRNLTGEYLFEQLVEEYENIKFVFSGHVNGSSSKIDVLDDNNDGINDRTVLQLLTDYQEEENLYGSTFIRLIKLYSDYNNILFDIYSPFYCDNDIIVFNNPDIVKSTSRFEYAFDISNDGFGIITIDF